MYSDEYIKKHDRDNLVPKEVGELIIDETKAILIQEELYYNVVLKPHVFKTHKSGFKRHIQYGEVCIGNILKNHVLGSPSRYFVVNGGVVKHVGFNKVKIKELSVYDRLALVMLEEIAHCFPNIDVHGRSFRLRFKYLYNKYYDKLTKSLKETIVEIEQRRKTESQQSI